MGYYKAVTPRDVTPFDRRWKRYISNKDIPNKEHDSHFYMYACIYIYTEVYIYIGPNPNQALVAVGNAAARVEDDLAHVCFFCGPLCSSKSWTHCPN